jgi:hypothetical protein
MKLKKIKTNKNSRITIDQYLDKVAAFTDNEYGLRVRNSFQDIKGTSELALLAVPSAEELKQLKKAVAIMTPSEKQDAENLSDEEIKKIAVDAGIDPGIFAIFINGYALHCKRVSRLA